MRAEPRAEQKHPSIDATEYGITPRFSEIVRNVSQKPWLCAQTPVWIMSRIAGRVHNPPSLPDPGAASKRLQGTTNPETFCLTFQ